MAHFSLLCWRPPGSQVGEYRLQGRGVSEPFLGSGGARLGKQPRQALPLPALFPCSSFPRAEHKLHRTQVRRPGTKPLLQQTATWSLRGKCVSLRLQLSSLQKWDSFPLRSDRGAERWQKALGMRSVWQPDGSQLTGENRTLSPPGLRGRSFGEGRGPQ